MAVILVLDDEREILKLVQRILNGRGHTTFIGSTVGEVLAFLRKFCQQIDLVISDNQIAGDELTGLDFLAIVRRDYPWIKCILMTSGVDVGIPEGVVYLRKPFDPDKMNATVDSTLERK